MAKDRFTRMAPVNFDQALSQFWRDVELSMDMAKDLFHSGVLSAEEGLSFLHNIFFKNVFQ